MQDATPKSLTVDDLFSMPAHALPVVLMQQWESANGTRSVLGEASRLHRIVARVTFVEGNFIGAYCALFIHEIFFNNGFGVVSSAYFAALLVTGMVLPLLSTFSWGYKAKVLKRFSETDGYFGKDLHTLQLELELASDRMQRLSLDELFEVASKQLVQYATDLMREEQENPGSSSADEKREKFKRAFRAAARFGLVDSKDGWKPFFEEARNHMPESTEVSADEDRASV